MPRAVAPLLLLAVLAPMGPPPALAGDDPKPCKATLKELSRSEAAPGETFEMIGRWGGKQGSKVPAINRGGFNGLEVVEWGRKRLLVRVPEGLAPGTYRVGVYCRSPSLGSTYSSGWHDFKVVAAAGGGARQPVPSPERREAPTGDAAAPASVGAAGGDFPVPDRLGLTLTLVDLLATLPFVAALLFWRHQRRRAGDSRRREHRPTVER